MFLTERAQKERKDRPGELPARILAESIVRTFGRKTYGSILQESAACICSCRKCSQDDTQILYQETQRRQRPVTPLCGNGKA